MKYIFIFLTYIIFSLKILYAQKESNIWYFGSQAGVDFNSGVPVALNNGQINTSEGCSSIADGNGNLLFYTDGITVWDRTHNVMSNGNGLLGNTTSSQSALIVKQPGSSSIYYVFTIYIDFSYSVVDISLNGGFGAVTTKNITLLSNCSSEKQCGTHHANGTDIWILMNEILSNGFKAFLLTGSGINSLPVISNVGTVHSNAYGQMKFSPDGNHLAVGVQGTGSGLELYDFDNSSGVVSNSMPIPTTYTQSYGVEFSPDNTKVYVTANPGLNEVYQFDITAGNVTAIKATETLVGTSLSGVDATGMQLGPDGKIYISIFNSYYLDAIDMPNNIGLACNYNQNAVFVFPGICKLGLPEFVSSIVYNSIGEIPPENQSYSVYPNPSKGEFTISANKHKNEEVIFEITDVTGRIVSQKVVNNFPYHVPQANLSTGVYLVSIKTKGEQWNQKLIIKQ